MPKVQESLLPCSHGAPEWSAARIAAAGSRGGTRTVRGMVRNLVDIEYDDGETDVPRIAALCAPAEDGKPLDPSAAAEGEEKTNTLRTHVPSEAHCSLASSH